jgi:hypothetical protein
MGASEVVELGLSASIGTSGPIMRAWRASYAACSLRVVLAYIN